MEVLNNLRKRGINSSITQMPRTFEGLEPCRRTFLSTNLPVRNRSVDFCPVARAATFRKFGGVAPEGKTVRQRQFSGRALCWRTR